MSYYVERMVNGETVTLEILNGSYKEWAGCFCLLGDQGE